jgi:RNA polymerase sigma-70 factor (ECF subfamily)
VDVRARVRPLVPPAAPETEAWVARARAGDAAAFRELFFHHAPRVQRLLLDLTGDEAFADEGTQETFVRAHRLLGTLAAGERFLAWTFGIARHIWQEELRRRRRRPSAAAEPPEEPDPALSPEQILVLAQAQDAFVAALARLAPERRAVFLLYTDHGLSYVEIARVMELDVTRVRNELHRGRRALRAALAEHLAGDG